MYVCFQGITQISVSRKNRRKIRTNFCTKDPDQELDLGVTHKAYMPWPCAVGLRRMPGTCADHIHRLLLDSCPSLKKYSKTLTRIITQFFATSTSRFEVIINLQPCSGTLPEGEGGSRILH